MTGEPLYIPSRDTLIELIERDVAQLREAYELDPDAMPIEQHRRLMLGQSALLMADRQKAHEDGSTADEFEGVA